jgi:hypothetical protein
MFKNTTCKYWHSEESSANEIGALSETLPKTPPTLSVDKMEENDEPDIIDIE